MPTTILHCTRRLAFDAAHRLIEHEGKCRFLHGHRYELEAAFAATGLDALGRVVDFGVVKERLGSWIDTNWDHNAILFEKDSTLGHDIARATGQRIYYLPYNPTAENMARYLLEEICPKLFQDAGVACTRIRLWETPNCSAEAVAD